uniref:Uncharacterized protein n=1 Tax=viral metagenome TaxID=1070528 RepID=A0A6C0IXN2_9ZZZZ
MVNYRTFQISDDLFWGFKVRLNIDLYNNPADIVKEVKEQLKDFLSTHNLQVLKEKVDDKPLHTSSINHIRNSKNGDIIYVCMCSHANHD